jgi:hypothetical protein
MALVAQLSSSALLLGDCNAHHTLWGINAKGEEVVDFLLWSNVLLFNDQSAT